MCKFGTRKYTNSSCLMLFYLNQITYLSLVYTMPPTTTPAITAATATIDPTITPTLLPSSASKITDD